MHHLLYKTTCTKTNRFYIGIHSTDNIQDGYLGSGKRLKESLRKHGRENHTFEILATASSREELLALEESTVTRDLLSDPLCLNLSVGGRAGVPLYAAPGISATLKAIWSQPEYKQKMSQLNSNRAKKSWEDPETRCRRIERRRQQSKDMWCDPVMRKHLTEKLKSRTGEKASQYGTCWVCRDDKPIKIKRDQLQHYIDQGYHTGRK